MVFRFHAEVRGVHALVAQANCTAFKPFQLQVTSDCPDCSPNEFKMSPAVYGRNLIPVAQQPVFIEYRIVSILITLSSSGRTLQAPQKDVAFACVLQRRGRVVAIQMGVTLLARGFGQFSQRNWGGGDW